MPLTIVHGPPNSGRAGLVRQRFVAALDRSPMLVVPNVDDLYAFERELSASGDALLGGTVATFDSLFAEVAAAYALVTRPPLTPVQRLRVVRAAIAATTLGVLRRSAARTGFARSLDELIAELDGAGATPEAVEAAAAELGESAYLGELAALFGRYEEHRRRLGRGSDHETAVECVAAVRREPDRWGDRPVLLYGFDDLAGDQLALVEALAGATEVTIALTFEDRPALAARRRTLELLHGFGPSEERTEADPTNTASPLLFALERGFLAEAPRAEQPDGSLVLLRSAGERGEAETIGAEIAALIAAGADPGGIAVALRDPAVRGPLYGRVLGRLGIPVAVEAEIPITTTATGGTLVSLLRAAAERGTAADLLTYLRGPRRAQPSQVDWLERRARRERITDAAGLEAAFVDQTGDPIADLERLRASAQDPARLLAECTRLARDIAEWPLARPETKGALPGPRVALELRAGATIAGALEELGELAGSEPDLDELIVTLEELRMPLWRGPATGRVRIASPYRLRAGRVETLFVASLQDGEFPRHGGTSPFLSDEQRERLGLAAQAEPEAEERYLFYVCLSLPRARLFLSHRSSDETGAAEAPSPFLDEVRRLLDPPRPANGSPDPVEDAITRGRGLGDVVLAAEQAPNEDELARALALSGADPGGLAIPPETAARITARIARADAAILRPVGLHNPAVLAELGAREGFGGTTLEGFAVCSYRWLVDHELDPDPIEPPPDPLTAGGILHETLHRLYAERPGGDPLPRPGSLAAWRSRAAEIVGEVCRDKELGDRHPAERATRRRVAGLIDALLRRESERDTVAVPDPELLEAEFGAATERGALRLGEAALHGRIDRVDVAPQGAIVRDYKLGDATPQAAFEREGKLQLPLYMLALRELWGIEPLAGAYQPLKKEMRPRGLGLEEERDGALAGLDLGKPDWLDREAFEEVLASAAEKAERIVEAMRAGRVTRDPIEDKCPRYCTFAPICRRERGPAAERELLPEAEEEVAP